MNKLDNGEVIGGLDSNICLGNIRIAHSVCSYIGYLLLIILLVIYSGYLFDIEDLYRPVKNGPATHELTIIAMFLLVSGILLDKINRTPNIARILFSSVGIIGSLSLVEILLNINIISLLTPFHEVTELAIAKGLIHAVGANTALSFVALSLAHLLRHKYPLFSFFICSVVPLIVFGSLVGYVYEQKQIYGAMSLITVSLMLPISIMSALYWSHYSFLKSLFLSSKIGNISRVHALLAIILPIFLGSMIIYVSQINHAYPFALYTTVITWGLSFVCFYVSREHEKLDSVRRAYERKILKMSVTDQLTGCYNRFMANSMGDLSIEQAKRSLVPIAVLMIDIDDFKVINDRHGHSEGDEVLKVITKSIGDTLRKSDVFFRWGGEEFLVILNDCSEISTNVLAEKILHTIENTHYVTKSMVTLNITASIGYVVYSPEMSEFSTMVNYADKAMYRAKQSGKNKVISYSDLQETISM